MCVILDAKEAEDKYLLSSVHSKNHVNLIKKISSKQFDSRRHKIALKLNSIYFNEGSSEAAYLAAGSAVENVMWVHIRGCFELEIFTKKVIFAVKHGFAGDTCSELKTLVLLEIFVEVIFTKKHGFAGDICSELKTLEQKVQPTEPYQMPELGRPHNDKKHRNSSVSAVSILSQSAAYKSLQEKAEKASKRQENSTDNDENENKNTVNKLDHGKAVEKPSNHDGGNDRLDIAMGMSGTLSLQRNVYPLTPFLSAPLLTAYNTVDPLIDPVLWTSLVLILPAGLSRTAKGCILPVYDLNGDKSSLYCF